MYENTANLVIVTYPSWSGGKFLINCLGLSDQCYLQSAPLVERQKRNELTPADKLNLLIKRINIIEDVWNDLNLGCVQLFGHHKLNPPLFCPVINTLAQEDKLFFVVAHNKVIFKELIKIWPKGKVIFFNGSHNFIRWRMGDEFFTGSDDFSTYQTQPDYPYHHRNLINVDTDITYWDADWYLDKDLFLARLQELYKKFNLTDYNQVLIETYYDNYMRKLEQMKNDKVNLTSR
jgi:hypothetical protein